jgi:hypothetical protein
MSLRLSSDVTRQVPRQYRGESGMRAALCEDEMRGYPIFVVHHCYRDQ